MPIKPICTAIVTAVTAALLAASPFVQGEEVALKAVTAWPKSNPGSQSFLRFIDKANKAGKGLFHINYIGGPEVTKPREQPNAMRNGLFDMMYGPGPYYSGLFPEVDFIQFTTPAEAHASGAFEMIRGVMKQKMGARFMGWFDSGLGLYLFTLTEPKRTASGGIDLTGLKMRSSPAYRNFIKDLGGTAIVMSPRDIYTALQRGTIDGLGTGLQVLVDEKLEKFVKYRIEPPMSHTGIFMIMNQKVYDGLPKQARDLLDKLSADWEVESRAFQAKKEGEHKANLAAAGMKTITLQEPEGKKFVALFRKGVWQRMVKNEKIKIDLNKLKKMLNYEG